jgi:hypothetical protein
MLIISEFFLAIRLVLKYSALMLITGCMPRHFDRLGKSGPWYQTECCSGHFQYICPLISRRMIVTGKAAIEIVTLYTTWSELRLFEIISQLQKYGATTVVVFGSPSISGSIRSINMYSRANVQCKRDWCVERCNLRSRELAPLPEVLRVST